MPKNEQRMDVEITAIFMNNEGPGNWDKDYAWKPSVAIQYKRINKQFQSGEETFKAKANGPKMLWVFDAMGGKNSKGHFYDIMTESGTINGHDWTSFIPLDELFKDGTMRRISPPEGYERPEDEPAERATPPPGGKPNGNKPATPGPAAPKTTANGDKLPPIAATYMDQALFVPQSDPWWRIKEAENLDGAIISNAYHYAAILLGGAQGTRSLQDEIHSWAEFFESSIRHTQLERRRERLTMMLGLCTSAKQVTEIVNRGWALLPKSHYDLLKECAKTRLEDIKKNPAPESIGPTPEPHTAMAEETATQETAPTKTEDDIPF